MVGLGDLAGGPFHSFARSVSGDGSVIVGVGNYNPNLNEGDAFVWTSGGGMQLLWDVLVAQGVDPAADGWAELVIASDISLDGSTIVGTGLRNGSYEAYIAVIGIVPEPSSMPLLLASGLAALGRRRGRRIQAVRARPLTN